MLRRHKRHRFHTPDLLFPLRRTISLRGRHPGPPPRPAASPGRSHRRVLGPRRLQPDTAGPPHRRAGAETGRLLQRAQRRLRRRRLRSLTRRRRLRCHLHCRRSECA
uniref:Uncharacterized protein n=1 Tax=Opuntia streptacantha TaxID=393608 RepID=A0A7C8ZSX8_OPUST